MTSISVFHDVVVIFYQIFAKVFAIELGYVAILNHFVRVGLDPPISCFVSVIVVMPPLEPGSLDNVFGVSHTNTRPPFYLFFQLIYINRWLWPSETDSFLEITLRLIFLSDYIQLTIRV